MTDLNDLYHYVGNDLNQSAIGGLLPVSGTIKGQQRILRRLLTNPREVLPDGTVLPADYIFEPDYGAGLARKVGDVVNVDKIKALITGQILLEEVVAKSPPPIVTVATLTNGLTVSIRYSDAITKTQTALNFDVNA